MRPEHWLYTIPLRLRSLFRWAQADQELDDELRDHLERKTEEYVAQGTTTEEARRRARIDLDGIEQTKEKCRDTWRVNWIQDFVQDLRFGLRMLRKSPGYTGVAVITLALGIGANTAIFSLIDAVMLRMLPVERPEELMQVQYAESDWSGEGASFTNPLWEQVRDRQDVFSVAFAWGTDKFDLAQGGAVHLANGIWVSGDFFNTLRLRPSAGRLISTADDQRGCPAVALLNYGLWQDP